MFRDPCRMFNADESWLPLCVTSGKLHAKHGARHCHYKQKARKKVTALFNVNSDYMLPLNAYPGQKIRNVGIKDFPGAFYLRS